jgi:hypothetical protein
MVYIFSGLCRHLEELPNNPVVLPEVDGVEGGQGGLFARPVVASHKAFSRLCLKIKNWFNDVVSKLCSQVKATAPPDATYIFIFKYFSNSAYY